MAERAINHLDKLIRVKTITSYVPLVHDKRFDYKRVRVLVLFNQYYKYVLFISLL